MVECVHGVESGHIIRPGVGTPSCPFCRRMDPATWVNPVAGAYDAPPSPMAWHEASHGIRVCQFGVAHSRCRCMDDTEIPIACDTPDKHAPHGRERPFKRARNA